MRTLLTPLPQICPPDIAYSVTGYFCLPYAAWCLACKGRSCMICKIGYCLTPDELSDLYEYLYRQSVKAVTQEPCSP